MHKFEITYHHEFADGGRSTPQTVSRRGFDAESVARCFVNRQQLESRIVVDRVIDVTM